MSTFELPKTCITCVQYRLDDNGRAVCNLTRRERTFQDIVDGHVTHYVFYSSCRFERSGLFTAVLTRLFGWRRTCGRRGRHWTERSAGAAMASPENSPATQAETEEDRT